jgi:cell division protein FtsB
MTTTAAPGRTPRRKAAPATGATRTGAATRQTHQTRETGTGAARARVPVSRARSPRTPFVLLILALLSGALVSLLLLNTVLAKDAFALTELQQSNKQLLQQRDELRNEIAYEESPAVLAQKARALGMIQPNKPAFVDGRTGQVIGGSLRPVPREAAAAAGAAGVLGVPGATVPGDGIDGWTGAGVGNAP